MATWRDVIEGRAEWAVETGQCLEGLRALPDACVHCCVTSPPYYGLRDYGVEGQIGLEKTPEEYVANLVGVFAEVRRVLRDDGTLWLNVGASYAGSSMSGGVGSGTIAGTRQGNRKGADLRFKKRSAEGLPGVVLNKGEPFALRDDLTVDEVAYVLSELATHFRKGGEVP